MKTSFALISVVPLCLLALVIPTVSFADGPMSATSTSVTLTAIVPEFMGFTVVNAAPVKFDFTNFGEQLADGVTNIVPYSTTVPTWTLTYNLKKRNVTVCAYASDLMGTDSGNVIHAAATLEGRSVRDGSPQAWFGAVSVCTQGAGNAAILLDTIPAATSSANTGGPRSEGFTELSLNPNYGTLHVVPAPDTYKGNLYIVAQAI